MLAKPGTRGTPKGGGVPGGWQEDNAGTDCPDRPISENGITTKTKCKIFSFSPFAPSIKHSQNINISTGEI